MISVFYGPDDYRRLQRVRGVVAGLHAKHPQALVARFDCADAHERERFREFAHTRSMFEPVKIALIENLAETDSKEFATELKSLAKQSELHIIVSEKKKPESPFGFLTSAAGKDKTILAERFEYLTGVAWHAFVTEEAASRGVRLSKSALALLADAYHKDTWRLITELDKLAGFSREVSEHDLASFGIDIAPEFWGVVQGLKNPAPARRLEALETLFAQSEPAQKIFHMIAYGWPEKLEMLAAYDRGVKSGKLDYEEALTDLAVG